MATVETKEKTKATKEKTNLWQEYLLGILLAAVIVTAVIVGTHTAREEQGDTIPQTTETPVQEKEPTQEERPTWPSAPVLVNDGVEEVWITPAENVEPSSLQPEDFFAEDGRIVYTGSAYRARQGVDVSEYQGEIDWEQVAQSGIDFAMLRIGCRGATEGGLYADERFMQNLQDAQAAGLAVGAYFFSQAITAEEAREEADYVLQLLAGRELEMPVVFDWETLGPREGRAAEELSQDVTDCAEAFCAEIRRGGYRPGVYFNRQQGYYDYDLAALSDAALWVSDPNAWPDFYYAVELWQYDFGGWVPGIESPVDLNLLFEKN